MLVIVAIYIVLTLLNTNNASLLANSKINGVPLSNSSLHSENRTKFNVDHDQHLHNNQGAH